MTPDVEELRHQHTYHPVPVADKSPALARVLDVISEGLFGDEHVYEPYVLPPFLLGVLLPSAHTRARLGS